MGAVAAGAAGGSQLIGDLLQGIGQQGAMNLNKQQFNQQFGLNSGEYADTLASQMQLGGLRDQVVYQLMNNLGQSPQAFNPLNYGAPTNTGIQGSGGYDLNQEAQHAAAYTPGAGGTNTNVAQATLGMLGYNNASDIQQSHNAGSTNYSYGGQTYANGTGPLAQQTTNLSNGYTLTSGNSQFNPDPNGRVGAGNNYTGTPYLPANAPRPGAMPQQTNPNTSSMYASALGLSPHAGYSLGGGGAPGAQSPSGPGTSGWGGASTQLGSAPYSGNQTMSPPGRVGQGSQINWGS